jgi:hypothetical protein
VGEIRHKTPIGAWDGSFAFGLDPARRDYASLAHFCDQDGNRWVLQERGSRNFKSLTLGDVDTLKMQTKCWRVVSNTHSYDES